MAGETVKHVVLNLTGLEIFFISTTLISLFFNLYQFMVSRREKRALELPLTSTLVALFNEVKAQTLSVYRTQQFLFHPQNPHKDMETLRWAYLSFADSVMDFLRGFQEALVGALVTLNPDDKEGKLAFRASDFGLTDAEKKFREEYVKKSQERREAQITAPDAEKK